jgi:hypothetical protein
MATTPETEGPTGGIARKLAVPVLIGAAGSALGFVLTKRDRVREAAPKLREAVSDIPVPHVPEGGFGELAGDLRGKLDEVLGRERPAESEGSDGDPGFTGGSDVDLSQFEERRREREKRRARRRQRSRR